MLTLSNAVDDLLERPTTDVGRLDVLARYCVETFATAGLPGLQGGKADEVGVRGLGRRKDWDLAYLHAGKPRLLLSLKSILKNLSGAIPNRLDDLMGEAANVQQLAPELVIGYVVVMDEAEDSPRKEGGTWIDHFESNLRKIAIRRAPLWNQGLIEASWLIRIDRNKPQGQRIVQPRKTAEAGRRFVRPCSTNSIAGSPRSGCERVDRQPFRCASTRGVVGHLNARKSDRLAVHYVHT